MRRRRVFQSSTQAVILEADACVRRRIHVSIMKVLDPSLRSRMTAGEDALLLCMTDGANNYVSWS
jgi:hypothetical protein